VSKSDEERARRLRREFEKVFPPPPPPGVTQRRAESFLGTWTADVVRGAHVAREERLSGEPPRREPERMSGVEILSHCVSYNGEEPPPEFLALLRRITHGRGKDGTVREDMAPAYNRAACEVLRRALARFRAELVEGEGDRE
jgi:hypothetical protein